MQTYWIQICHLLLQSYLLCALDTQKYSQKLSPSHYLLFLFQSLPKSPSLVVLPTSVINLCRSILAKNFRCGHRSSHVTRLMRFFQNSFSEFSHHLTLSAKESIPSYTTQPRLARKSWIRSSVGKAVFLMANHSTFSSLLLGMAPQKRQKDKSNLLKLYHESRHDKTRVPKPFHALQFPGSNQCSR